jgi:hypothetical protein
MATLGEPEAVYGGTMIIHAKRFKVRILPGVGLLMLGGMLSLVLAQKAQQNLPLLTAGAMPLYPLVALHARIEGIVKIRVSTDGKKVSSLEVVSGPPMLSEAARNNILTWEFAEHRPTTFVTTFEYIIEDPPQCEFSNGTSVLNLPLQAHISAKGLETCDPAVDIKSRP